MTTKRAGSGAGGGGGGRSSGCSYNTFTTQEEAIKAQWAQVQNQIQRRNDLIPNLVETVKGYATHEEVGLQGDRRLALEAAGGEVARGDDRGRRTSSPARSAGCSRWSRTIRT